MGLADYYGKTGHLDEAAAEKRTQVLSRKSTLKSSRKRIPVYEIYEFEYSYWWGARLFL